MSQIIVLRSRTRRRADEINAEHDGNDQSDTTEATLRSSMPSRLVVTPRRWPSAARIPVGISCAYANAADIGTAVLLAESRFRGRRPSVFDDVLPVEILLELAMGVLSFRMKL
jgi:hypothetical protein